MTGTATLRQHCNGKDHRKRYDLLKQLKLREDMEEKAAIGDKVLVVDALTQRMQKLSFEKWKHHVKSCLLDYIISNG